MNDVTFRINVRQYRDSDNNTIVVTTYSDKSQTIVKEVWEYSKGRLSGIGYVSLDSLPDDATEVK